MSETPTGRFCWYESMTTNPDVKATTVKAKELGATVLMEMDVPEVGSFAIIADPQG
ncbi:MAG: hypothetical protein VX815_14300 [Gemmatimonadota bacterium]|nr:hypothetical protein [Gemmatimonadota bacterium]